MEAEIPEELPEEVLFRIVRGDAKGRSFGTPRSPLAPTLEEFNPKFLEVRAGDLGTIIVSRRHGIHPEQAQKVGQLSNEDLVCFWLPDPISAVEITTGLSLTGGHHRTNEIISEFKLGHWIRIRSSGYFSMIELMRFPGQVDRVEIARRKLLELAVGGSDPRWSSDILDRLVAGVMELPGGSPLDLLAALYELLGEPACALSPSVATFVKELVITCYTRYRSSYEAINWADFAMNVFRKPTSAQLYLMLHAIPPQFVSAELSRMITLELETTPYRQEVMTILTD